MTPEEWQKVRPILESALELDPSSRLSFLYGACSDASLRREVESLIAVHEQAGTNALRPGTPVELKLDEEAQFRLPPGKRIGAYEILEEIAVGGMGAVYRAIRADGQYHQQVALKIVRSELGAEATATRFRNERQILASLDHPNIARILDGGTTADGLPYFVMEFIDGLSITGFCDQNKLTIDERLKIFRTVCSAVHYAHQHLVIHRDIKPTNILVATDGVPKLLDFGIAKMLDPTLIPENAAATATLAGLWIMTPEYASPEQLRAEAITTATDVYSLGLVLYELLAGHRAYRLTTHLPHEIARAVLETDPEKPSSAIRRKNEPTEQGKDKVPLTPELVSGLRADSPEKLGKRLAGDLDNIVLKAIRKETRERYSSADQLSEDIRRHLENLPVLARKSTVGYRCRKYVLRHKVGVAAAALVFVSLVTGIALTIREARIARANELRAERRFNDVRKLANSLMFEVHDSIRDLPGAIAARKLIIQRAQEYLDSLSQESKSDPALLRELATAYSRLATLQGDSRDANLGNTGASLENRRKAIELGRDAVALDPQNRDLQRQLAEDYTRLDLPLFQKGDREGERECLHQAQQILEPLASSNPKDPSVQHSLSKVYELQGSLFFGENNPSQALQSYEAALHINERLAEAYPENTLYRTDVSFGHKHLGSVLLEQNHLDEALEHYRAALAIDEAQLAMQPDNLNKRYFITYSYDEIGRILGKRGDFENAISYIRKALEIRAAQAAADPRDTRARAGLATTHTFMGEVLHRKQDYSGALKSYREALSIQEALARSGPATERVRLSIAETKTLIGKLYVAMSAQPNLAPAKRVNYCGESRPWFDSALPVYLELQSQGKLRSEDLARLAEAQKAQQQCREMTTHQRHSPQSSPD